MAIAPLIVAVRTFGANQLNNLANHFRRTAANIRASWNRAMNNFIARGGFFSRAAWAPIINRFGQFGAQAGQAFARNLGSAISSATDALGPLRTILVAAAVGAAPFIAAALNAAILLGVGGGVLAAGIIAAVQDPRVSAAWKQFSDRAKKSLAGFAEPFKEPLIRAANEFGAAMEGSIGPALTDMAKTMAPIIDILAPALSDMAVNALPGIKAAVQASVPLFEQLAAHAPAIGKAISDFFRIVAESGPAAERVFGAILSAIEFLIPVIGGVINVLSNLGAFLLDFQRNALSIFPPIGNMISNVFSGARDFIISAFGAVTSALLGFFGQIVNGAARAFGWIPGIGPKLQQAAAEFNAFAARVNAAINGIQKTVTITVRARLIGGSILNAAQQSGEYSSGSGGRASGGSVMAGRTYRVGERGPELVTFGANGYVHDAAASRRMMAGSPSEARSGYGGGMSVQFVTQPGADGLFAAMFNKAVRTGLIQMKIVNNRVVPA